LAIKHPDIVAIFSAYFNDIWQGAEKIKMGTKIDYSKVENVKVDFG